MQLRGESGTWNVGGQLFFSNTSLSDEITSPPNSGGWPIAIPDGLTSTIVVQPQAAQYEWEDTDLLTTLTTVYCAPYMVIQHAQPSNLYDNKPVAYSFESDALYIHPGPEIGSADTPALYGATDYVTSVGREIYCVGSVYAGGFNSDTGALSLANGFASVRGGANFTTPQVIVISTLEGGIAAEYVGVDTDLHVGDGSYLANGCVIGRGAQDHSQDGSLWLETQGDYTAPTTGSQETRIYTSQQGTHFVNRLHSANEGSTGTAFMFDSDVMSSRTLITSNTLSLEGSSYEGQGTINVGDTAVTVSSSFVAAGDKIIASYPEQSNSGGALWVEQINPGVDFLIRCTNTVTDDTAVNWAIIK